MQAIRHVLFLAVLAVVLPATYAEPAAPTPAPAPAAAPARAKTPPRAPTLVSVTASETGSARAATQPADPALNATASASAIVDSVRTISLIQAAPLPQRDTMIREVGSRIDAAQRALVTLREHANSPGQRNGRAFVFQSAFMQARTCEQALRKSLQAARESNAPSTWATAQAALMRNYADYAKAVADVEAAGRNPVALSP